MRCKCFALIIFLLSAKVNALELSSMALQDQWDKEQSLSVDTRVVIFSQHKEGGQWVRQSLEALQLTDLAEKQWLYVADISKMPGLITRMFALPKMRDYGFAVALVRDHRMVEGWPAKEDAVAVYRLDKLSVQSMEFFTSADALKNYLQSID